MLVPAMISICFTQFGTVDLITALDGFMKLFSNPTDWCSFNIETKHNALPDEKA